MKKSKKTISAFLVNFFAGTIMLVSFLPMALATEVGIEVRETPESIVVTPNPANVDVAGEQQFTATATFSCAPQPCDPTDPRDVTTDALTTWSSDSVAVATVENDNPDFKGLATGVSNGTTNTSSGRQS